MNAQRLPHLGTGILPPAPAWWKSKPPLPREHGAWVMLYAPLAIGCAAAGTPWLLALWLTLTVTGLFLARDAAGLLIRHRGKPGTAGWLVVYLTVAIAGGLPLLMQADFGALLPLAALAFLLFGVYSLLSTWPTAQGRAKRLDRSQWGEVLGAGALTLTAPAAAVVTRGQFDGLAWCLWVATALFFASGVFHVKMLLGAARVKTAFTPADRWRIGRDNVVYHLVLGAVVIYTAWHLGPGAGWLAALAYAPVVGRGLWSALRLTNRLPSLKRVGVVETLYALWFMVFFVAALR